MRRLAILTIVVAACDQAAIAPPPLPVDAAAAPAYVGPEACADCHEDKHARWSASLHATMNQLAGDDSVIGDFDGATIAAGGGTARFLRDGDTRVMELAPPGAPPRRFRVTRTIGSRYLQEYAGIEEGGDGVERRLPFGWWPRAGGWAEQASFDSWLPAGHDPFTVDAEPWAARCAWCHNTYPLELKQEAVLPVDRLVTVGISCESCHLAGGAHVEDERAQSIVRPGNEACARCHSTPAPRFPDGGAVRNSSEAFDLAASACAPDIQCIDCHDPHTAGAGPGAPDQPVHLAACLGCHPAIAPDHARHPAGVATCLDCHMPRIVQGISAFVRTHRISSPTDPAMLAIAAPNACNLCHLDRSLQWTIDRIEEKWGRRLVPEPSWAGAYGGRFDAPLGELWLRGEVRTYRILAAAAFARSPLARSALPAMRDALDEPVAFFRTWMQLAIEDAER